MIVVQTELPCIVLAMEGQEVLGFAKDELVGQSVLKLLGAKSDLALFHLVIKEASNFQTNDGQFILYDKDGNDKQLMVSFIPYSQDGHVIGCLIALHHSEAITLKQLFEGIQDNCCPYCLVAADPPHAIHMANEDFTSKFSTAHADALSNDLLSVVSAHRGLAPERWASLLLGAGSGRRTRCRISMRTAWSLHNAPCEDLVCTPVVEAANGRIRHVLVHFAPPVDEPPTDPIQPAALPSAHLASRLNPPPGPRACSSRGHPPTADHPRACVSSGPWAP
eukprot:CAMPEP_0172175546 /NCGR_PEP_ID=MMETSP1050-20130122/14292_1 /TAXON_ID=233186 /ORGANISM="Cryptomonas curvata, Strain CCAP979/52" /LENGTH=277 /DNA_ID=CAMNT_0012847669 /DNA_START=162 /DNA_END=992 /DNA_ORIENTATION=+